MNRTYIPVGPTDLPQCFSPLFRGASVYDSSCSPQARVLYIDTGSGLYLKSAAKGTLADEAAMTRYLHSKGLCPEVIAYESLEQDWLLTAALPGEDCIHPQYLEDPVRLTDSIACFLRRLHEISPADCPMQNRTALLLAAATENYDAGKWDASLFSGPWIFSDREDAWNRIRQSAHLLKCDSLIHGDYCLPNIMMDKWNFSGFLDVGAGGVGDRHFDLFWGAWTLFFNLKTHRYTQRFLDAYGREAVEPEILRLVAAIETFL